jgi:hypothetical protein
VPGPDPAKPQIALCKEVKSLDANGLEITQTTVVDYLSLEDTEPISNLPFGQLMDDVFSGTDGRGSEGFIIARMQTRDRVHYTRCFYHHYYAPNLVTLLFKTPMFFALSNNSNQEEPLISRYHATMPLTVRDPLNNEIVVGEVEFYLVKKSEKGTAHLIGTDFNYANSNDFRRLFMEYSSANEGIKEQVKDEAMAAERSSISPLVSRQLQNNQEFTDYAQNLLRIQRNNMSPRLFFNAIRIRNKNVYFHGAVLAFFTISVIYTFITGCQGFAALTTYEGSLNSGNDTVSDYYSSGDLSANTDGLGRLLSFEDRRYLANTKPSNQTNGTISSGNLTNGTNSTSNSTSNSTTSDS